MKKFINYFNFTILLLFPIVGVGAASRTVSFGVGAASRTVSCGNVDKIPYKLPELVSTGVTLIEIAVPIVLVIMGMLDFFNGIVAQKEDEIKKNQQLFVKRLIVAAVVFFVIVIAKLLVGVVADSSSADIVDCIDCFISNKCS